MDKKMRDKLTRACFEEIKKSGFPATIAYTGDVYDEEDEEKSTPTGKFILIHTTMDGHQVSFDIMSVNNKIYFHCPSYPDYRLIYYKNNEMHSWSGITGVGEVGEPDYISMQEILTDVIGKLKIVFSSTLI